MSHLITWEQQVKSPKLQANVKLLYIKYTERNNTTLLSRHQVCLPISFLLFHSINGTCFGPTVRDYNFRKLREEALISNSQRMRSPRYCIPYYFIIIKLLLVLFLIIIITYYYQLQQQANKRQWKTYILTQYIIIIHFYIVVLPVTNFRIITTIFNTT